VYTSCTVPAGLLGDLPRYLGTYACPYCTGAGTPCGRARRGCSDPLSPSISNSISNWPTKQPLPFPKKAAPPIFRRQTLHSALLPYFPDIPTPNPLVDTSEHSLPLSSLPLCFLPPQSFNHLALLLFHLPDQRPITVAEKRVRLQVRRAPQDTPPELHSPWLQKPGSYASSPLTTLYANFAPPKHSTLRRPVASVHFIPKTLC